MDEQDSNAAPRRTTSIRGHRRTVIETGTTALILERLRMQLWRLVRSMAASPPRPP